ncbi:CAZyme family GH106 [Aspergillus niger]|nr:CAZyme family GH106 [Aspergillus niger]KAI2842246.1 CAZyme family GH106 [Aspergillus niger]
MELLGLYNYGGSLAPQPAGADWATYGFGTPAFNAIFKASLQSAKSTGMIFDFALGPSQGQGVPANPNDEGLHWDLAPFNVSVPPNGAYNGQILGWGTGELVSLVSARVVNTSTVVNPASSLFSTPANNATRLVLAAGSLVDHTDAVSVDGKVSLSFNVSEHSTYRLFAYYQYQDLVKNLDIHESSTGSIFDNGSYTVDHFSARGAQTTIDFWENYILNDTDIKSLFQEVGRYGWEDSIEIKSNISWSPSLPGIFEQINGYQLGKYLPLVMYGNNNSGVQPSYPGNLECVLDRENQGQGYVNDFRDALEKGYQVYLDTLSAWLEGLGLGYSAQVSYNLPINMEVNINHVLAPECESLAFNNNIDGYRQFSGVANLANLAQKNVIPNEMGANLEKAFALPVSELLGQINTAFAGGVNQIVLHGQSYTGDYHKTTWPGYTFFFILFAESYYNKQPAWGHGFSDVINYISRNQYILQAGQPRTDIILYNRVSMTDLQLEALYSANNMINTDYTYTYLSPANSNLSQASVAGGLLAPHSPAYKAIVVTSDQNVTLAGVNKLQHSKGYRDLPSQLSGGDLDGDIFNVIWDTDAYPVRTFAPADYPRVSPVDIGRPVERDDMAQFFLDFMKTDHLGVIATRHMIMADQEAEGTSHPVCRKLAQLHSTAVDFSKTGIPVQMSEIPKGKPFRPDFMAPGPVARIHNKSDIELEEYVIQAAYDEDDDMEPFHKYYRSEKILGKLYRGVDERQIWQEDIQSKVQPNEDEFWNEFLWSTLERCDKIGNLSWELWLDEARHIRLRYEEAVFSARNNYSEHPIDPLSELEVFIGSVMNKGVQTRRQRDQSNKLADEFDRISTWIVGQMRAGSSSESPITSVSDQLKPLEFCLACIHVGGESNKDPARRRREVYGEIKSFRVVAACALLFELDLIEKGRKRKF